MINFSDKLDHFDGKRYSKATGLEVTLGNQGINLWQVNSKGELGRCYITIPLEKVDELCALLQSVKK